jgi:hypothetical protein
MAESEAPTATPPLVEQWKHNGVQVIPGDGLDSNTAQTPGT